eukprot:TRINITY_DN2349_c0_g3_i1.p1 TRINITY_DN2349_c0_g3~~TRINITY_DN2349_c0_g3_i1.p1  ORF type:complete len:240 (-),score=49.96 TRINITY_DN2349_c0_g3_i1:117-836(-)
MCIRDRLKLYKRHILSIIRKAMLAKFMTGLAIKSGTRLPMRATPNYSLSHSQLALTQPSNPKELLPYLFSGFPLKSLKQLPANAEELFISTGFTLMSSPNSSEVKLVKQVADKTIEISYQAKELGAESEIKEEGSEDARVEFTVTLKDRDGSGAEFTCVTGKEDVNVLDVSCIDEHTKASEETCSTSDDLDETLSDRYLKHLKALGVTKEVARYIQASGIDEEHRNYLNLLQEVKGFSG